MSMTIKSNAEVAMCMEDYNNEIILGNAIDNTLKEIWNGEKYKQFRKEHFEKNSDIKCIKECDMKLIGDYT
jgi:radical SAM protein with 4Fe4S-binding SPASM domain